MQGARSPEAWTGAPELGSAGYRWGGAGATPSTFFEACDELGLLVWMEFWITGDCDGRGATAVRPPCRLPIRVMWLQMWPKLCAQGASRLLRLRWFA